MLVVEGDWIEGKALTRPDEPHPRPEAIREAIARLAEMHDIDLADIRPVYLGHPDPPQDA